MGAFKITTTQGDTLTAIFNFKDTDGEVLDITGATVKIVIRNVCSDVITKTVTSFTDPTTGVCTVVFSAAETILWPVTLGNYEIGIILTDGTQYGVIRDWIEVKENLLWT